MLRVRAGDPQQAEAGDVRDLHFRRFDRIPVRVVFARRRVGLADTLLFLYLAAAWVGVAVAVGAAIVWAL